MGGATAVLVREHTLALQESADGTPRGTAALGGHTLRTLHFLLGFDESDPEPDSHDQDD